MSDQAKKKTIAIFCGSKTGENPLFAEHAASLGKMLATSGFNIVYGGGDSGLMGIVANQALIHGASVTGVIPKVLIPWEQYHKQLTELIITDDMHVRKKTMYQLADAAIILPGGMGTLDELFEILTWNQLSIHNKNIFILNTDGFYSDLIDHMKRLEKNRFLYHPLSESFTVHENPVALIDELVRG
jgi:uncharacterized protein (TIGR00730 family)